MSLDDRLPKLQSPEETGTPVTEYAGRQRSEEEGTVDGQFSFVTEAPPVRHSSPSTN